MVSVTTPARITNLLVDADLNMGAYNLLSDDIEESSAGVGVTIDGAPIKDGAVIQGGAVKAASDNLRHSHDAEVGAYSNTAYEVKKTLTFPNGIKGIVRIKFAIWSNSGILETFGQIWGASGALGTEQKHMDSGTYNTYSEDIDVGTIAAGGVLYLKCKIESGNTGKCKELRLYYDNDPDVGGVTNS